MSKRRWDAGSQRLEWQSHHPLRVRLIFLSSLDILAHEFYPQVLLSSPRRACNARNQNCVSVRGEGRSGPKGFPRSPLRTSTDIYWLPPAASWEMSFLPPSLPPSLSWAQFLRFCKRKKKINFRFMQHRLQFLRIELWVLLAGGDKAVLVFLFSACNSHLKNTNKVMYTFFKI